jgi:hypothetical protein
MLQKLNNSLFVATRTITSGTQSSSDLLSISSRREFAEAEIIASGAMLGREYKLVFEKPGDSCFRSAKSGEEVSFHVEEIGPNKKAENPTEGNENGKNIVL